MSQMTSEQAASPITREQIEKLKSALVQVHIGANMVRHEVEDKFSFWGAHTKQVLADADLGLENLVKLVVEVDERGAIAGRPATQLDAAALMRLAGNTAQLFSMIGDAAKAGQPAAYLKSALYGNVMAMSELASSLFEAAKSMGQAIKVGAEVVADVADVIAKKSKAAINWMPWVLGAIFLGPIVISLVRSYQTGGAGAFLDATEHELRSVQGPTMRAGRAVGRGAMAAGRGVLRVGQAAALRRMG